MNLTYAHYRKRNQVSLTLDAFNYLLKLILQINYKHMNGILGPNGVFIYYYFKKTMKITAKKQQRIVIISILVSFKSRRKG